MSEESEGTPEMEEGSIGIYVLPTEEGKPPRALLTVGVVDTPDLLAMVGKEVEWSNDAGAWVDGLIPIPDDLGQAITEHAKNLGVEW